MRALLGSHVSVAGGLHEGARRLHEVGGNAMQVFTKNSNQWAAKPVTEENVELFNKARKQYNVDYCVSHDSYLINLAAVGELGTKSYEAFVDEIRRCDRYGIGDIVFHPGAHVGAGVEAGLARVAERLVRALEETADTNVRLLIEITAGQGTCLCARFEEVRDLLGLCGGAGARLGTCFDTCHAHAAGYDLSSEAKAAEAFDLFDKIVGASSVKLFHLNDAKKGVGSRADRHEHIGKGTIGLGGFRALARDKRFRDVPKVLETEKGTNPATGRDYDAENLECLRKAGF
ncbi:MAG: deoxyribonuclease IV [Planctomycetes bacterium]|nr:deoxyribonuclease IV [Planctomycetota bacterium]